MAELEKSCCSNLTISEIIKFYCRYVGVTLLLLKAANIGHIHNLFNNIDKNLCFTVDHFENEVPHFLDIKLSLI